VVRTVEVALEARPLHELQLPAPRLPRRFQTVEASLRLDAVASAGFGLSRNRMAELIRQGRVRLNWQPVSSPSRALTEGDRVQLEGRGELELETVTATKRERWRIELVRC
jgi:RNA-binding protein YlmH